MLLIGLYISIAHTVQAHTRTNIIDILFVSGNTVKMIQSQHYNIQISFPSEIITDFFSLGNGICTQSSTGGWGFFYDFILVISAIYFVG